MQLFRLQPIWTLPLYQQPKQLLNLSCNSWTMPPHTQMLSCPTMPLILHVHSDASYQSESQSRSWAGGYCLLSSNSPVHTTTIDPKAPPPPINGNVHVTCSILRLLCPLLPKQSLGPYSIMAKTLLGYALPSLTLARPSPLDQSKLTTPVHQASQWHCQTKELQSNWHAFLLD
jgi:hypothetical protein